MAHLRLRPELEGGGVEGTVRIDHRCMEITTASCCRGHTQSARGSPLQPVSWLQPAPATALGARALPWLGPPCLHPLAS